MSGATGRYKRMIGTEINYECNFSDDMPELNYDNEDVKKEALDVAKYYLDLGIDGFRFDAVKYIYYGSNNKSASFWDWYATELRNIKPDVYLVGECYDADGTTLLYYGALNCFAFGSATVEGNIAKSAQISLSTLAPTQPVNFFTNYVTSMYNSIKKNNPDGMYIPFISNHDMDRAAGYLSPATNSAQMAANLYLLCSGSPFIYYGEEIGMKGTRGSANTDANRRLAMLWGDGDTVADPVGTTYLNSKQTNGTVAEQLKNNESLLRHYQKVIRFRTDHPEIARGEYAQLTTSEKYVGGFVITYNGNKSYLIHNTSVNPITVELGWLNDGMAASSVGLGGVEISGKSLTIDGQTSVIIK